MGCADPLGVSDSKDDRVAGIEPLGVTLRVPVADTHTVALPALDTDGLDESDGVTELVTVGHADKVGVPVAEAHTDTDGRAVAEAQPVAVLDRSAEDEDDTLAEGLEDALSSPVALAVPDNVAPCEALLAPEPVTLGDTDAQSVTEDDGETDGDAVADVDTAAVGDAHADDDDDAEGAELGVTLGEPVALTTGVGVAP